MGLCIALKMTQTQFNLQPSQSVIIDFLAKMSFSSRTHSKIQELNAVFTQAEIQTIITTLPTGKFPGPDSFVEEYYKTFQHSLVQHVVSLFDGMARTSTFPLEMLKAYKVTIPKPSKDPTTPQNFHPM